ncbi:MAG TPA: hypothetical protein VLC91_03415 [Spongiibacteraceae bacterium]|nr:hypothetical protein [Spongiibacteraceae bacterium]
MTVNEADAQKDDGGEQYVAIEVVGFDRDTWKKRRHRFVERITNSFKSLMRSQVPGRRSLNDEAKEAVESLASSAQSILKVPQIKNLEKVASIQKQLSEVRVNNAKAAEIEANARLKNLEADKLAYEIERDTILESQHVIDAMLKQGKIYPVLKDGQLTLVISKEAKLFE